MNQDANVFTFDLSRAELYWLAGAFGIVSLPLPDNASLRISPVQQDSLQKDGHASLLTRGLLRPSPGFGWQVERLPAALVQWIASAPSLVRLERIARDGTTRRAHLFTSGEQGLFLKMDGDAAHFVIYKSLSFLREAALRWLSLPQKMKSTAVKVQALPQPLIFLPAAWKDPQLAARILEERGAKASKTTLNWVSKLEWAAALSLVKLEGRRNSILRQFVLCGNENSAWGEDEEEATASFVPMTMRRIDVKIAEILK